MPSADQPTCAPAHTHLSGCARRRHSWRWLPPHGQLPPCASLPLHLPRSQWAHGWPPVPQCARRWAGAGWHCSLHSSWAGREGACQFGAAQFLCSRTESHMALTPHVQGMRHVLPTSCTCTCAPYLCTSPLQHQPCIQHPVALPPAPAPWILPASRPRPGPAASASRSRSCSLYTSMKAACSWYSHPCSRSLATDSRIWRESTKRRGMTVGDEGDRWSVRM